MSDVSNAPAAPAPGPAPAQSEVPVNTNPTSTPNPQSNTPPEKAPDAPPSRREAIQAAFDRANKSAEAKAKPEPKAEPKAAEAKPGHNNPPEETPKEAAKKPQAMPAAASGRNERGQFAGRQAAPAGDAPAAGNLSAQTQAQPQDKAAARPQLPPQAPFREPPQRMSEQAKAEWASVPDSVRGDVHRMHEEFGRAYQQYRGDHEYMNTIRPFVQMAHQQGTTVAAALNNYVGLEHKLRQDLIGGLDQVIRNLNQKNAEGQPLTLRDVAYHVLSTAPDELVRAQTNNAQQAASQQINALHQEIAGLKNALNQMHNQQQYSYTRAQVDDFAKSHPRFDELAAAIHQEVATGYSLEDAYRRADLLYPEPHAAQTRTQSAQTRDSDRSISGAPAAPASPGSPRRSSNEKPVGRRDAIANAIKRASGSL